MITIEVTEQELIEFVKSKGDASLNMRNSMTQDLVDENDCGCLFYEYTRSKYPDDNIECGTQSAIISNDHSILVRLTFPVYWRTWCPINNEGYTDHTLVHKFSDLVIPV